MKNFIEKLELAIDLEYDFKLKEVYDLKKKSIEDRILKGDSIKINKIEILNPFPKMIGNSRFENGKLLMDSDPNFIWFQKVIVYCDKNLSKFRVGTPVLLTNNRYSFDLTVMEDHDSFFILKADLRFREIEKEYEHLDGWILDSSTADIRRIVKKSINYLISDINKLNFINGIISGKILPKINNDDVLKSQSLIINTNLNLSQKEAFTNAFATSNFSLIQGPPGSGKTWVLAHLAVEFAKMGKKVLITAFTHTAINNALNKISYLFNFKNTYKVGQSYNCDEINSEGSNININENFHIDTQDNSDLGFIVGATCYSPHTRRMEDVNFDIVIFDEAGQLSIPLAVAAMVKADKYIFIGDHKQLPPIICENQVDTIFKKSIFEQLSQFSTGTMLNITYRMNKWINAFPSEKFYDGKLLPDANNDSNLLEINNNFEEYFDLLDKNKPDVLFCHYHESHESLSEYESQIISVFINEYLKQGVSPKQIAIITPFRSQVRQIKKSLSSIDNYESIKNDLFVDTVERIQGQERDIVIYSLATSNPIKAMQRASFFFSPNRFNVAITRARKKRIVIGHENLFLITSNDTELDNMINIFRDFYNSSYKVFEQV